jgi:hypothetical protein
MSADYFFIGLGSNNLNQKAFRVRRNALALKKSAQDQNAQNKLD